MDNDIVGENEVHSFLQYHVDDMIERANEQRDNNVNAPELPLIRLRYEFNSLTIPINSAKFGLEYLNRVANPTDILLAVKKKDYSSGDNKSTARSGIFTFCKLLFQSQLICTKFLSRSQLICSELLFRSKLT